VTGIRGPGYEDESFRQDLPVTSRQCGKENRENLPEGIEITVAEVNPQRYVVLPGSEMTDEELESVVGGVGGGHS